ncbi:MAG: radical SAM protein [Candidatus Bathyarchaeota archaeon]|nr:radical SAM protein [Candidatus Bathyarchaeota archaeon]
MSFSISEKTLRRHSPEYNFLGLYEKGITFRWGKTFQENPALAPFPELADISISNSCSKGCDFCYRDSTPKGKIMDIDAYKFVLEQLTSQEYGPVFQIALGGGEPTEHPQLEKLLLETRKYKIIPNLTTNATAVSDETREVFRKTCGAIAISMASLELEFIKKNVQPFLESQLRTNIHFLLTNKSLKEAIEILNGRWDSALNGVNAVVFLTHKTIGRAKKENNLTRNDEMARFLHLVDQKKSKLHIGFDACFVPLLITETKVDCRFLDSCECGFFSIYINEALEVKPCSFANDNRYTFSLEKETLSNIWNNKFADYRKRVTQLCTLNCNRKDECRGGCLFHSNLNLCKPNNSFS